MFRSTDRLSLRSARRPSCASRWGRVRLLVQGLESRTVPAMLVVTSNADVGAGSLRDTIITANTNGEADTITFSGVGAISLSGGQMDISEAQGLFIDGGGGVTVNSTAASGATSRIFNITATGKPAIGLKALTLSGAKLSTGVGGAILFTDQPLTLTNCTFTGNTASGGAGGAIGTVTAAASVTLTNCTFTSNSASTTGGGISLGGTATVTINQSTFKSNSATSNGGGLAIVGISAATITMTNFESNVSVASGGGVHCLANVTLAIADCTFQSNRGSVGGGLRTAGGSVTMTLDRTTVTGNTATTSLGGGFYMGNGGNVTISDCTFSKNTATTNGGALRLSTHTSLIQNSTFSGNVSNATTATTGGGAIVITGAGNHTINNSTITNNSVPNATAKGGGILTTVSTGTITFNSTIIAGNTNANNRDLASGGTLPRAIAGNNNLIGAVNPAVINLTGSNSGALIGTEGTPVDAGFEALASNGGPTQTHALKSTSPALNSGTNILALANDQRGTGYPRVNGGVPDIGSFEAGSTIPSAKTTLTDVITAGGTVYIVTVDYTDETAINTGSIDVNDVKLSGPGFGTPVAPDKASFTGSGKAVTATYEFTPPGGAWDSFDDGVFTVSMVANQVFDTDGPNAVFGAPLGTFKVGIPQSPLVVDNGGDVDDGNYGAGQFTLREAVRLTNAAFNTADSISFAAALEGTTITLGSELSITDSLAIAGPGATKLTLSGNTTTRLFNINSAGAATITIGGMTVANGNGGGGAGGALTLVDETLNINDSVFSANTATGGGGAINLSAAGAVLTINNSTFSGNSATTNGGAVTGGSISFNATNSKFINNSATTSGGALSFGTSPVMSFDSVTFSGNKAGAIGGGVHFSQVVTTADFKNSSFSDNTTGTGQGGGVAFVTAASAGSFSKTTFTNNKAFIQGGGVSFGGTSTCTLDNVTFDQNVGSTGGALFMSSQLKVTATNSKFLNNSSTSITGGSGGGAIRFGGGVYSFTTCTFDGNKSAEQGGAISSTTGPFNYTLIDTTFTNNTAANVGGGIASTSTGTTLVATNVTFDNNSSASGGAVYAVTTLNLTFTNTKFTNNSATGGGGAIRNGGGTVTTDSCTFDGNTAGTYGGAIGGTSGPHVYDLKNSTFTNNAAGTHGGALAIESGLGTMGLINCTVDNNSAATGGGVYLSNNDTLNLDDSTISNNSATSLTEGGGGVALLQGGGTFKNSTISGNVSQGTGGGGIAFLYPTWAGTFAAYNSTITKNSAPLGIGGGLAGPTSTGTIDFTSCIVAGNTAMTGQDLGSLVARNIGGDNNLVGTNDNSNVTLTGLANQVGTDLVLLDPSLNPLGDNGGFTKTHALKSGSKALDMGSNTFALAFDQRGTGFVRELNGKADIGSFEGISVIPFAATTLVDVPPANPDYIVNVVYEDENSINLATIDVTDLQITGPGFVTPASPTKVTTSGPANKVTASYFFTPPGGAWDVADNGVYTVSLVGTVQDGDAIPHAVAKGALGTFEVGFTRTFTVDIVTDEFDGNYAVGDLSFREATFLANVGGAVSHDTIAFDKTVFAGTQTITLSLGQMTIADSLTIIGPGIELLTIDADFKGRHLSIGGDGRLTVSVSGMTFINGTVTGPGGAILLDNEELSLTNVKFTGNKATTDGGAIQSLGAAKLTMVDCAVIGNTANRGAGISLNAATAVTMTRCTVSGNTAADDGGGIYFFDSGSLVMDGSTVSGNTANTTTKSATSGGGGGIYFYGKITTAGFIITNSTISGNKSTFSRGGGIAFQRLIGNVVIRNSTITGNYAFGKGSATYGGGGIVAARSFAGLSTVTLQSTIVAGNTVENVVDPRSDLQFDIATNIAGDNNLIGINDAANNATLTGVGNLIGDTVTPVDAKLAALANNGGPTLTHALLAASPAIDAGNNLAALSFDQRGAGFARANGKADIGAYEVQPAAAPPTATIKVNGGAAQRSLVTSFTVTFSESVNFVGTAAAAITLQRLATSTIPSPSGSVVLDFSPATGPATIFTVTINDPVFGPGLTKSLIDGKYSLTLVANQIKSAANGQFLDGNGDATAGDDKSLNLHRLFGDADGDGDCDNADFVAFRNAFGTGPSIFDSDGDGDTDNADFVAFRGRFGTMP